MESENYFSLELITSLSDTQLLEVLNKSLDQVIHRLRQNEPQNIHNDVKFSLTMFYSKLFLFMSKIHGKSIDPQKYTPFRANLFDLNYYMQPHIQELDDDEVDIAQHEFLNNFYLKCFCKKKCHNSIRIQQCLDIHLSQCSLSKKKRAEQLGAVLLNLKTQSGASGRQVFNWSISRIRVCKDFFMFVYKTSDKILERLQNCIKMNRAFDYRWRGSNGLVEVLYQQLDLYLKNKLNDWSLPNPNSNGPEFYLPFNFKWNETYNSFCNDYKEAANTNDNPMSWLTFYKYYTKNFDTFKRLQKKSDYCDTCTKLHLKLQASETTAEEKNEAKLTLNIHLEQARRARQAYRTTKENLSLDTVMLSFDFSENILLPHLIEQPAIFYFRSRRKIECFGITNENSNEQLNYIVDECHRIQKGPNAVLSMLYHYLCTYVAQGSKLTLYSDNSPAQNKNHITIAFFCYLVKVLKLFEQVELYFMISGHTKFAPDAHFGRIKHTIKNSNCFSILDLVANDGLVRSSADNNFVIPYKNPLTGEMNFSWFDWKQFLHKKILPCTGIRNWHVISINQEGRNINVKQDIEDDFQSIDIIKENIQFEDGPNVIEPDLIGENRINELEFFKAFTVGDHQDFISKNF